ncbi:hypothetical protein DYU05_09320 [Mucilaginibacter terrenus]|uniref:Endonuclease/exonuclease/phosphatase domain-containing protein n=1 Tax=Mucilaginibacter terrenus TaxID=2482727 RepID=A0A3E2NXM8_9SPHI|nr:endonuclease/exonuclease/phosphatase family protein [Mucilaginibacter terrenus]RFZ85775.1 hypothetical protein DYU05_09320 [Mucilaginibacter terrenus]
MKSNKNKTKRFLLIDKVVLALNLIVSIALIISYFAPSTDPRDSTFVALLGFGMNILIIANASFIVYWAFRKPLLMLIPVLCILIGFQFISSQIGFNSKTNIGSKAAPDVIRIMHFNVREFRGIDKFADLPIENEVFDIIKNVQPDVLNMVEFSKRKANKDSISQQLVGPQGLKNYYFKEFKKITPYDTTGNVIFSKYPIINSGVVDTGKYLNTKAIFADLKLGQKIFRVYCIHLAAVTIKTKEKGRMLDGKVDVEKSSFIVNKLESAFLNRSFQVAKIKRHIEKCPYPYVITGDFNDTPNSYAVNELGDGLKNAFDEKGAGFETTYYSSYPLHIDYIFLTQQFEVLNYSEIDKKVSDHKALVSDVKLK